MSDSLICLCGSFGCSRPNSRPHIYICVPMLYGMFSSRGTTLVSSRMKESAAVLKRCSIISWSLLTALDLPTVLRELIPCCCGIA